MITRLTPYGLFAIAANAAGTFDVAQLGRLQVYLIVYGAAALFLCSVAAARSRGGVDTLRAREVLTRCRDAFVTAFAVGDLFIVLPMLIEATKDLLERHDIGDRETPDVARHRRVGVVQLPFHRQVDVAVVLAVRGLVRGSTDRRARSIHSSQRPES